MAPEVKICGLTRGADAAAAIAAGARYLGVVFADSSPRCVTPAAARALFRSAGAGAAPVARVGVFSPVDTDRVLRAADEAELDVLQLHGTFDDAFVERLRRDFGGAVWRVARVAAGGLDDHQKSLFGRADGVVLDTYSATADGGTGRTFPWSACTAAVAAARGMATVVVAGGLRATNVAEAIAALAPDVVDVSSGVEVAPGIKDPAAIEEFVRTVRGTAP